jgi:hypothetical protein
VELAKDHCGDNLANTISTVDANRIFFSMRKDALQSDHDGRARDYSATNRVRVLTFIVAPQRDTI